MPTRNVVLTSHNEDMIERLVTSGRYQNASEVLREGLRLVEQRENLEATKLEALRTAAKLGFADLDEGRFIDIAYDDIDNFMAEIGREAESRFRERNG